MNSILHKRVNEINVNEWDIAAISDAILDAHLEQDPDIKVICETASKTGFILILREVSTHIDF